MAIGPVITEGFGSFGTVGLVVTEGYTASSATVEATILTEGFGTNSSPALVVLEGFHVGAAASYTLTADEGAFTLTGEAILFEIDFPASDGSFSLTGESAYLLPSGLPSDPGYFTLTGYDAFGAFLPITDTDLIGLPINCVLMGRQLWRYRERASELWPRNLREKGAMPKSGIGRLKGDKPSFTVKTGTKGYD
jgi:hypothetical protein